MAAQPPEAAKIRPDGGLQHRPEGSTGSAEGAATPLRAGPSAAGEPGGDAALAEEHERALGKGRLIDVLG
ncbi:MAG: hypothetical protein ACR2N6_07690 [Miltoncostaeaceae bacterium]